MKRLLLFLAAIAACDPELTVPSAQAPPDGGPSTSPTTVPTQQPLPGDGGPTDGGDGDSGPGPGPTAHEIDGKNDFKSGETFTTTSAGYTTYISWDAKNVYFGANGADIASGSSKKWVLIYVDGNPGNGGTAAGIGYDCGGSCTSQAAALPFNAGYHIRWKADGTYTNLQKFDGTAWVNVGPISTVSQTGLFLELSITRAALGSPTRLKVNSFMIIEDNATGWTYAGAPAGSFTDGLNGNSSAHPSAKYFDFDLGDTTTAPNAFPIKP